MKTADGILYFDNAATTYPKPESVIRAVTHCMRESGGNPGRGSHTMALRAAEEIYACREEAASFFGASAAEQVIFTMNTTHALNLALKSVIRQGDHVLIGSMEHNAVLRPVAALASSGTVSYSVFSARGTDAQILSDIRAKIRPNTRVLITAHVPNIANTALPIEKIGSLCRQRGITLIVDGAQSAGHLPIDVGRMKIDMLCVPGHKGLYGVQGCGMIVCGSEAITHGRTLIEGGSGVHSLEAGMPEELPERYEAGTLPTPAIAGLSAGIRFVKQQGIASLHRRECDLWRQLYADLSAMPHVHLYDSTPGSVLLFNIEGISPAEVSEKLNQRGICVRSGYHCAPMAHKTLGSIDNGGVRVSFGAFHTERDVCRLRDVIWNIARQ